MARKILVINGSPRKERSGSLFLTKAFISGIQSTGEFETEFVNISDLKIIPCKGCLHCWKTHANGQCAIQTDDVPAVRQKIEEADYVIVSMPLYYFGMPGSVKILLDRLLGMVKEYRGQPVAPAYEKGLSLHGARNPKENRKFAVIVGAAWVETDISMAPLYKELDYIFGVNKYARAACPQLDALIARGGDRRLSVYQKNYAAAGVEFTQNGFLSEETQKLLSKPAFSQQVYEQLLGVMWDSAGEHN